MLVDTHCHIHEADYSLAVEDVRRSAHEADVRKMICVGTNEKSSQAALDFAAQSDDAYAAVGVHPHDTKDGYGLIQGLAASNGVRLVAVGEIGLDYFYTHSPREVQIIALESQIQSALDNNLPIIFHVREAFDDFWPIFDNFHGIRGELHSFTDSKENLEQGLKRGLYIGVNGISTFTKDTAQQTMFNAVPIERMLLETDAPFLTPAPKRGTVNQPAYVAHVAAHHAKLRGVQLEELASITSANAIELFSLD